MDPTHRQAISSGSRHSAKVSINSLDNSDQSLPKGGPVQTSYEEKLWLYSLYKQGMSNSIFSCSASMPPGEIEVANSLATEGDISVARPGLLDMLGRAKWDSWNKQKGIDKTDAKRQYVAALIKVSQGTWRSSQADEQILRKHAGQGESLEHIAELEAFAGGYAGEL